MLAAAELVGFLATRDPDRSRSFFVDTLGLELVADDPFALVFDSNGTQVRVAWFKDPDGNLLSIAAPGQAST